MSSDHPHREVLAPAEEQGKRLRQHLAYKAAYETWMQALPEDEQHRMRELGLGKPVSEQFGWVKRDEEEDDFAGMEIPAPMADLSSDPELERELNSAIMRAIGWAVSAPTIVEVGRRWLLVMHIWRSPLVAGLALEFERELQAECVREVGDDDNGGGGQFLEWSRRGPRISEIGERVMAMAYVLWPESIGARTLQSIGALKNKTRQAVDKLVQDFRDTFGGVRSPAMRDDNTRLACKITQLQRRQISSLA